MRNEWLSDFIYNSLGVKLEMTSQQKEIINDIKQNRFNYFLKSRQIGFSELLLNYISKELILETDFTIILVVNKFSSGNQSLKKIKSIIDLFDPNLIRIMKKDSLELNNGNLIKIVTINGGIDKLRGYDFELLIFDECYCEAILSLSLPVLSAKANCKLILGSSLFTLEFAKFIGRLDNITLLHYSDSSLYNEERINSYKNVIGKNFEYEMELNVKEFINTFNSKEKSKSKILQFRVDDGLENKILERLINLDVSFSEYIRNLIIKDLK